MEIYLQTYMVLSWTILSVGSVYIYNYIYMVFCIFNGIFYSMKNEYQKNHQIHINIFIKEGNITGIIGLLEYSICWFHVYIYMCVFWTYGIMLCFMHVIVDHSMHDERSSSNLQCFPNHPITIQSFEGYNIVENIDTKCNIFPAIP